MVKIRIFSVNVGRFTYMLDNRRMDLPTGTIFLGIRHLQCLNSLFGDYLETRFNFIRLKGSESFLKY